MSEVLLSNLNLGEKAVVVDFKDEDLSLKLLEMGCLPGVEIEVLHFAPFGDPIAVKVSGYTLSMRKQEASEILVERIN
ncbi:MAG: hypothetical protein RIR51_383 [Bacteroidota bacterium]|jgi:ferrous iron transport protein A